MADARAYLRGEHGGSNFYQINVDLAEVQFRNGRDGYRWDGEGWFGGDINRLAVRNEGGGDFGRGVGDAEVQALQPRGRSVFQSSGRCPLRLQAEPLAHLRHDRLRGTCPYWFDVDGALFLSDEGDVLGRVEGYYDQRITQPLVLQPRAGLNLAAQDVPENGIGSGLRHIELGLRLRYEIKREFAP